MADNLFLANSGKDVNEKGFQEKRSRKSTLLKKRARKKVQYIHKPHGRFGVTFCFIFLTAQLVFIAFSSLGRYL